MTFLKKQIKLPEFLNNYLKYRRFVLFNPSTTVDALYFDLTTFFRFLYLSFYDKDSLENITIDEFKEIDILTISIDDLNNVTSSILIDFTYFCNYKLNNESKARNRKLASLKSFFRYLETNNLISKNPTLGMQSARTEKRLPKYLNLKESKNLLSNTINSDKHYKIRNYTMTCLFLNCGLRLSELTNIDMDNMKLDEGTLKVCGKGNKERIIYLDEACIEAINEYLKVRPKLRNIYEDYNALFLSSRKKRISQRNVQAIIKQELKDTFTESSNGLHTHTLRHTSATLLYNSDVDILVIEKILGHSNLKATEIYTHIDSKKMKYIMNNCAISNLIEKKMEGK